MILDPDGVEAGAFCTLVTLADHRDPRPFTASSSMLAGAPTFALDPAVPGRAAVRPGGGGPHVERFDLGFSPGPVRLEPAGRAWVPGDVPSVDTLTVAQGRSLGLLVRASLVDCCTHFDLSWADHHSALGDGTGDRGPFWLTAARLGDDLLGVTGLLPAPARSCPGHRASCPRSAGAGSPPGQPTASGC